MIIYRDIEFTGSQLQQKVNCMSSQNFCVFVCERKCYYPCQGFLLSRVLLRRFSLFYRYSDMSGFTRQGSKRKYATKLSGIVALPYSTKTNAFFFLSMLLLEILSYFPSRKSVGPRTVNINLSNLPHSIQNCHGLVPFEHS